MSQESPDLEYVGFWPRLGASLVDGILMFMITMLLVAVFFGKAMEEDYVPGPMYFVLSYGLPALTVILLWFRFGATPGKMAVKAVVVDARTGSTPGIGQCIVRYVGYIASTLTLGIGYLWIAIDARKQGWHDKMAGTVVIRRKAGAITPVQFDKPHSEVRG